MKRLLSILIYLCSAWFVATGILLMLGVLNISNKSAGFLSICYGLNALIYGITRNTLR